MKDLFLDIWLLYIEKYTEVNEPLFTINGAEYVHGRRCLHNTRHSFCPTLSDSALEKPELQISLDLTQYRGKDNGACRQWAPYLLQKIGELFRGHAILQYKEFV